MTASTVANSIASYRQRTDAITSTMACAGLVPKLTLCVCCERKRTTKTGTMGKRGFVCNHCGRQA